MKYISGLILIGFIFILLVSFMPMNHNLHGNDFSCPIASIFNVLCGFDTLSMVTSHILAMQSFLNIPLSSLILWLFLLVIGIFVVLLSSSKRPDFSFHIWFQGIIFTDHSHKKAQSWLSLLENSPSLS